MTAGTVRKRADGRWIADVTLNGIRRTANRKTKGEAVAARRELLNELAAGAPLPGQGPITRYRLADARRLSMQVRWAGRAFERTAAIYSKEVIEFIGPETDVSSINAQQVTDLRAHLQAKGNRPATINSKVSTLRSMLADAHMHGHLAVMPAMPPKLRLTNTRDRVFSNDERDAICQWFISAGQPAAASMFVALLETCCRWGELEKLRGQDVDLEKGRVTFWETKANRPRSVPLSRRAMDALRPHIPAVKSYRVCPYKYQEFSYLFKKAKEAVGINDEALVIHCTRHTAASKMASAGISLQQIMQFGGWSSLQSVQRYLHLSTDALAACITALED
jgi:integrase